MLITNFSYNDFCNLLTSILESSFNISTTHISNINDFNNYVDIEFRKIVWPNYNPMDSYNIESLSEMKKCALCVLKSAVEFTTIVFSFPKEISNDILIFGPFLEVESNEEFINNLLIKNSLPEDLRKTFSLYYNSLPVVNIVNVIATLNKLLECFISTYNPSSLYYIDFSKNKPKEIDFNYDNNSEFDIEYHKKYKSYLQDIFKYIRTGKEAGEILTNYLELTGILKSNSIDKIKNNLYILNTQFESELLKEQICVTQIRELSIKNQNEIENENNRIKLIKLPYKILKRYSNLIANYNLKEYSYTVRDAIEHINLNLQSNLSLSTISKAVGRNASFLSNQFKKETGKTITKYIQEKRIEEAIRMLTNTDMTIQEISHSVGIDDLSWFSKLFKSIVGISPTKYKSNMYKNDLYA